MTFKEKLKKDVILLDGAFGTYAQSLGLSDAHFKDRPGCMEYLSLVSPEFVTRIHHDYLEAGSDAVETNTFGANAVKLSEYGLADKVYEINLAGTRLARIVADSFSSDTRPRYVIGDMGPTGKLPSSTDPALGDIGYRELKKIYHDQALGIIDGGADALLVETAQDLLEMKAAVSGAKEAMKERAKELVLMAQCTLANNGRMLLGTEVSAVMATMGHLGVDVVGLNCSTGPLEMERALGFLGKNSPCFISCVPNAGLPVEQEGRTVYPLAPREMAGIMARFSKKYGLDVIGGCCGTSPDHIREMRKALKRHKKRKFRRGRFVSSFYAAFDTQKIKRPIKIGERINTQGSKKMKGLLMDEDYDSIVELAKHQQRSGAEALDVCAVLTERSTEKRDAVILTRRLSESVRVPLMIDSTSYDVMEAAVESYPGTALINSVNLEDGGDKARRVFALAKEHGSFIVNLVIDKSGMARTAEHKIKAAEELYSIATGEYGIEPYRLLFDMLTFTLGTGEKEYRASAMDTYRAIRSLKRKHPQALTVLGVSNVSFGLPKAARGVLNMVFLHHAVRAGLDAAIVNPDEYIAYKDIPPKERKLAEDLIFNRRPEALARLVEYFSGKSAGKERAPGPAHGAELPVEEKLKRCIFERNKSGIVPLLDEAMKKYPAEEIINNVLMDAMKEVGSRLDSGEMVLPYVLQSAEVMRKAIEYLENYLSGEKALARGKVLLATVFGDVHDIGKNLVKMILENNGFKVIDLGKQVPVEKIIEEAGKNKVDAVGLSALLVSTACHMKTCVQSMHDAGLDYPILLGGAPINKRFAKEASALKDDSVYSGGVFYARDAFTGLSIMQALMDPAGRKKMMAEYREQFAESDKQPATSDKRRATSDKRQAASDKKIPTPPFHGVRTIVNIPADEVFARLDQRMLFDLAWGAKARDEKEKKRLIEKEYRPMLHEMKEECIRKGWLDLKAVYGYFKCRVSGEEMEVIDESGHALETFDFPRSGGKADISLADYFASVPAEDVVMFQAVTVGDKVNEAIGKLNEAKEVTKAFLLHGLSVHLAEALAGYIHDRIRAELGLGKQQGKRYSPGYPLWKRLEDQKKIFRLLDVTSRINVRLTEAYQMVPEQSTTAMVVHSAEAKY